MKKSIKTQALVLGAVLLGLAGSASAGFVPVFTSETTTGNSSTFNYVINFSSNGSTESLVSGDFFTLYDIGSSAAAQGTLFSISSSGTFTFSLAATGQTPAFTAPPDSASIGNVTATYGGTTLTADTQFSFALVYSSVLSTTTGYYGSTDTISLGKNSQAGLVIVPRITIVPEPSTWAAFALGGGLAMGVAMRRRQTSVCSDSAMAIGV